MIGAIILFAIAIIIAVVCIIVSSITDSGRVLLFLIVSILFVFLGVIILATTPTNKDVREGKAHYVEQNHIEIVNDDTINTYKTYEIVWIENSKSQ